MNLKKLFTLLLLSIGLSAFAVEPTTVPTVKIYGFVGNDFYYNSRINVEACDGLINLFPKAASMVNGIDANAIPQAEMLSVNSRIGMDINGVQLFGAKSSGKIEADFAGTGTTFFLLRVRQAYAKLNWNKTELLLGQTWHPLFGNVAPTTPSLNGGAPFQPFNRSPQLRIKYAFTKTLSATLAAIYEMQYVSQGSGAKPNETVSSNSFMKNAQIPNGFIGLENKNDHWITGIGFNTTVIKPTSTSSLTSVSAMGYAQFTKDLLTVKGKAIYGQNLSDQLMIGGYGICDTLKNTYTNFNTGSGWLNVTYGKKWQAGLLLGCSQNLGTNKPLDKKVKSTYTFYGYGTDITTQTLVDRVLRVAPCISYNLPNLKFSVEYDATEARYGKVEANGHVANASNVINHRTVASVSYIF